MQRTIEKYSIIEFDHVVPVRVYKILHSGIIFKLKKSIPLKSKDKTLLLNADAFIETHDRNINIKILNGASVEDFVLNEGRNNVGADYNLSEGDQVVLPTGLKAALVFDVECTEDDLTVYEQFKANLDSTSISHLFQMTTVE